MKLREIAASIGAEIRGNGDAAVTRVASIALADADSLVFAEDETALREALDSQAAAVLVTAELARQAGEAKPLLVMRQPRLGFARAAKLLRSSERRGACILRLSLRRILFWVRACLSMPVLLWMRARRSA